MAIELELRLKGEDVNEDSLEDLIDWLERAGIDGLEIKRKEPPPVKGDMGVLADPAIVVTVVSTVVALADIAINVVGWRNGKEVEVDPTLVNPAEALQENEVKIKELLTKMKGKAHKNK
ncbi:hypothetical protein QUF74_04835 [Candidatus Halobeggiatoa sp. HSG11]|nr:hypothetical protein [Candidatus Halobeggiatoa sp. HSG11]